MDNSGDTATENPGFLDGGGELGALMRAHDWSRSPLGAPDGWPQSLRSIVALMINSRYPMFVAWGPELAFLYNDGYAPIFGKKHPHMLGVPFREAWTEIWDDILPLIERALAGEATFNEDLHLVMERNGYPEDTWYSFSYSPVRDESGQIAGMFCACTETTETVLARRREADERSRMMRMFDQAPGFMAILEGSDHRVTYHNATYAERMGGRGALGKTVAEAIPEAVEQGFVALLDKVYRTGEAVRLEASRFVARQPDGSEVEQFVDVVYQPLRDATGKIDGIFIEGYSVTDRVQARADADTNSAWLNRVMLAVPAAIYVSDRVQRKTVFANEGMTRILGYSAEEICAMPPGAVRDLIHADDLGALSEMVESTAAAEDGTVVESEYRMRAKDGHYVWLRDRITVLSRNEDGSVAQTLGVAVDIGERLATEQALAERSAELEQIMLAAPAAIWISRGGGEGATEANALGRIILGLPTDAPIGAHGPASGSFINGTFVKPGGEAFGPNEFPLARALKGERVEGLEVEIAYTDRPSRYLLVNAQPFGSAEGSPSGAVAVGVDVSDRHRLTEELRDLNADLAERVEAALAERAILADIIDETDAFVQVAAPDYTFLAVNAASARQFKRLFKRDAQVGENMLDILAEWPEHQARAKELWGRAFAGESFTEIREFDLGSAGRRYYESRFRPLRSADDEITAAYQFVTDITDRMRNEARLRTIFDTSFQFQSLMDLDGTLREANASALAAIGRPAEEVIGRKMWDTPWFSETPGLAERVERTIAKVVKSGEPVRAEIAATFPQGRRVFDFSIRPMLDPAGVPVGLISEATELAALREAEAALLQAQKLESMGQLTGGVAHDFNNLLTPIVGALDLLQRRGIGNELEQSLISGAMQSAERARTLVQRLLAFARRQPLQAVPVDIAKLVSGMAELVERTTGPQVRVVTEVQDDLPAAVADANQLELAVLNLAVNARDAMPDGGTLRISANERLVKALDLEGVQPGRYVCLSVADSGVGMDAETRARAIEPFFSTKGVGQGTGLGLSMAHGLASQLGGALTIDSHPGVGTNVMLWLPATEHAAAVAEPAAAPAKPGKGSILLVDDEPLVRATTAGMLDELGYEVTQAESGEAALTLFEGGLRPDFLVTDHLMPGMSGTELARAVRDHIPGVGVLVISGYAESKGVDPDLARLAKPFRSADLAQAMSALKPQDSTQKRIEPTLR